MFDKRPEARYGGPVEYASLSELRARIVDTNGLDGKAEAELRRRAIAAKVSKPLSGKEALAELARKKHSPVPISPSKAQRQLMRKRRPGYPQ